MCIHTSSKTLLCILFKSICCHCKNGNCFCIWSCETSNRLCCCKSIHVTIGDRHCGQISVPGGSSLRNFVLFSTRLHSNKHTHKPESSFLELSDFFYRDTYRASRDTLLATVPVPMAPVPVDRINDNLTLTVSRQAIPHHRSIAVYVCSLQPAYSLHLFFSLRPSLPPHQKHTLSRLRDSNTFFRDLYFYFRKGLVNFAHVSLCIY